MEVFEKDGNIDEKDYQLKAVELLKEVCYETFMSKEDMDNMQDKVWDSKAKEKSDRRLKERKERKVKENEEKRTTFKKNDEE